MIDPRIIHAAMPGLVTACLLYCLMTLLGRDSAVGRMIAATICILAGLRYMWWRWTLSMPVGQAQWQQIWAYFFLTVETFSTISSVSVYVFMSRVIRRGPQVDARAGSALLVAPTDVFIATYNEDYDILERTLVGATSIDHPDLRVWVLDDGARGWVQSLATEFGAHYVSRVKGKHAKAGNVNNGLAHALRTGRRPRFILLLDADFVSARYILKRTLPLFEEEDVGIVQTPQHFFNADPIQSNLLCMTTWPDEQRFFFNHLLESKDSWGAAFCCGTSAVFRVTALEACGGMSTATVTEDMLTSFRMLEVGFRTVFLNEALSLGLAPEGLKEYISQRSRWCLGAIQQCFTRWSFAGAANVGLVNRLSAFDGVMFWSVGFLFKLMMATSPLMYWWTDTAVITSTPTDMAVWLGPYMVSGIFFMGVFAGNTVIPILTDVTHLLAAPTIVRTVAVAIVKPWGHPFKVTAKGVSTEGVTIQWRVLLPFALIALGILAGIAVNTTPYSALSGTAGYSLNIVWSVYSIALMCIACAVCVELPKRRRNERFMTNEAVLLRFEGAGEDTPARFIDVSTGGALLSVPGGAVGPGGMAIMTSSSGPLEVPFRTVRSIGGDRVAVRFLPDTEQRRALIRKLFTGAYSNDVMKVRVVAALIGSLTRLFR